MKKYFMAALSLAAMLVIPSCQTAVPKEVEDSFLVSVTNDSDVPWKGLHFEYYLDQKPIGGATVEAYSQPAFDVGEQLTKDFIPRDFPENADLSGFGLEVFVVLTDGSEALAEPAVELKAEYGVQYDYRIQGNEKEGFLISPVKRAG